MDHKQRKINWSLYIITGIILAIGLVNLYSAAYFWGEEGIPSLFWSQLAWILIGLFLMIIATFTDYRIFNRFAFYIYIFINVLLLVSLLFGKIVKGTAGWIQLGPVSFQPTEFAKIACVIVLAKFYSEHPAPEGFSLKDMVRPAVLIGIPFVIIVLQGDMGSSLFFILIFTTIALFVKIQRNSLILLLVVALISGGLVYQFGLKDYQKNRKVKQAFGQL